MPSNNVYEANAGASKLLTNIVQTDYMSPGFVLRLLFPIVGVGDMTGLVPTFQSTWSEKEEPDDGRAPGGGFNRIEDSYGSRPFNLDSRGFKYAKNSAEYSIGMNSGVNWGVRATNVLMDNAAQRLERQQAALAGNANNYNTNHTASLGADAKFNSTTARKIPPGVTFRAGNRVVRNRIGRDPNVLVLGGDAFDALAEDATIVDRIKHTSRDSVTLQMIARLYNYQIAVKVDIPQVFDGNALTAYVDPRVIQAWLNGSTNDDLMGGFRIPYRINGNIDQFTPNFGYTFAFNGAGQQPAHPYITARHWSEDNHEYDWKLLFNRQVQLTGVDDEDKVIFGYLHTDTVTAA